VLAVSSRLGPYEIVAPLGAGGMGEVYRARDTRLGREVAVKVLPERFADDPHRLERFEREARAVAALTHPNILAIHDYGTHGAVTYAVMELLEGETLRGRLAKGPLPWREAVEVGAAIAEGLAAAHAKGIVHRDLKPENLFLTADGRVIILDFGLARVTPPAGSQSETGPYVPAATDAGTVLGTVGYMSPEQVRGQPADARSDLFSLGCVLYEMVTGRRAFQRETAAETMTAILHDEPPDPSHSGHPIPAELSRLVRQCLAKSPNQRLQSARDLALALRTTATDPSLHRLAVSRPRSRLLVGIGVALFLIGGVGTSAYFLNRGDKPSDPGTPPTAAKQVEAVAVLPFENQGDSGPEARLSDPGETLAEHLSNSLSQVRRQDLKVRPFDSVARRYKQQRPDISTIGRELNVQVLVIGTVRQQGDALSVSVSLVDARDDNQFWGKRYDRKLGEILDLQDQIARDVAANLRLRLTGEEEQRLTKRYTDDPEVYFLYREGMHHINKLRPEEQLRGKEYFERALKKDPNYAPALMGMARADVTLGSTILGARQTHPGAKKLLLRVLATDDTLADAHAALAMVYMVHDWDWPAAERAAKRAFELGSPLPMYGFWLMTHGRPKEALPVLQRGQALDPLSAPRIIELAICYNSMREYDRAVVWARKAIDLDPALVIAYGHLGKALVHQGMHEEAIAQLQKAVSLRKGLPHPRGMLGYAYAKAGRKAEAQKVLEELKAGPKPPFGTATAIARIHAGLGEKEQAIEWLRKACDERDSAVMWLKVDRIFDNLRTEPGFAELLKDMGLPP
jgi:serine/threonine protein kinase/tetratricopeptide (TPR) repeat protein